MFSTIQFLVFLSVFQLALALGENSNLTELLELVDTGIENSNNYILPDDNTGFLEIQDLEFNDYGTFDFIVVGAGAAGSIVANRLSEVFDWKVLVLEAGGYQTDFTKIIGLYTYSLFTDFNWGYNTSTQKNACLAMVDQQCTMPRGKAFGGSTAINVAAYTRGHSQDFDIWSELTADEGWSYEKILPYFKKSEKAVFQSANPEIHGFNGLLTVNITNDIPGLTDVLLDAYEESCFEKIDLNSPNPIGVGKIPYLLKGNERVNTADAFLKQFLSRNNLNVSLNSFVTKILIDDKTKTAYGVEFVKNKKKYVAKASKEVILSGGSINSPQILMLSGLGPKEHLEEHNITVIKDLPVGQTLKDHLMYIGILLRKPTAIFSQDFDGFVELYKEHLEPLISGAKVMHFNNFVDDETRRAEIETLFFVPSAAAEAVQRTYRLTDEFATAYQDQVTNTSNDLTTGVILLHPKSQGSVKLQSNSSADFPLIDVNYLSEEEDVKTIYKGIQDILALNETEAFKKENIQFIILDSPGCDDLNKMTEEWWYCSIRRWSTSTYHPQCSTRMGQNSSDSVVDNKLKVHGIKNLRVVDAGVFPDTISAHTVAATMMVAERAGDIIKTDYGL